MSEENLLIGVLSLTGGAFTGFLVWLWLCAEKD